MMDCKNALTESAGELEAAVDWLRKKGLSKAAKKGDRIAAEGLIAVVVKAGERDCRRESIPRPISSPAPPTSRRSCAMSPTWRWRGT